MSKFRATWREFNIKIDVVEIDKEYENYVYIRKVRYKKRSETQAFCSSWEEAHQWLLLQCADLITRADARLRGAKQTQAKVLSMKES